jgi:tripartite-type tricarboxylate transporter receptor subunit TctC
VRRTAIGLLGLLLATLALVPLGEGARAQAGWPQRPVRLIVPLPPGGTADATARLLAEKLGAVWGQPVVVENRAGGSGIIGTDALAKAAPDGYTIGMGTINTHATNAFVHAKLPYDVETDFTPLVWLTTSPLFLIAHPSVPADTLQEFVALARAQPGRLTYATIGVGSSMHLATEMLAQRAGLQLVHVPYKGMGAAMQDLLAGTVMFTIDISAMAQVRQGKLKALGVASTRRYPGEPATPSFAEQGLPDFELVTWLSLHAPAGLPAGLQRRIVDDVNRVLATSEVRERIRAMNLDVVGGTPEQLTRHLAAERRNYAAVIRAAGIKAE